MSGDSFDADGEAHEALSTAVNSYGVRVLSDPRVLGNLVTDLLPDLPRERSLLVTAAEAGVAAELSQHVEGQHLDVETAVALVARSLTESRMLDPAASIWVSTEYAQALGYQVRPQAPPTVQQVAYAPTPTETVLPPQSPPVPPLPPVLPPLAKSEPSFSPSSSSSETRIDLRPAPRFTPTKQPPASPPQDPQPPAATPAQDPWQQPTQTPSRDPWQGAAGAAVAVGAAVPPPQQPAPPVQDAWRQPAPPATPQPWPAGTGGPAGGPPWPAAGGGGRPPGSRRGLLLGGGGIAAVIVVYLVIAAVAQTFPFSKAAVKPTPSPPVTSPAPHPTTPVATTPAPTTPAATTPLPTTPSPIVSLAAGVKPLKVLLPFDIQDASTECVTQAKIPWTNPGLVRAMECTAPDMPGGQIFGYQLSGTPNYAKAWSNYNSWAQFGTSNAQSCPPPSGQAQGGPVEWFGPRFAKRAGQVIECFTSNSGPVYVWTYPTEDAFIVAQPPKSWTFSKLETWWEDNAA
jgi:hypothetical protein